MHFPFCYIPLQCEGSVPDDSLELKFTGVKIVKHLPDWDLAASCGDGLLFSYSQIFQQLAFSIEMNFRVNFSWSIVN